MKLELSNIQAVETLIALDQRRMRLEKVLEMESIYGWHLNLLNDSLKSLVDVAEQIKKELEK